MDDTAAPKPGNKSAAAATADAPSTASANALTGDDDDPDAPRSNHSSPRHKTTSPTDMDLWTQLELEKSKYPGASTWAPDEERLFELLFFRQALPILPSHWELDLSAVPIAEVNFAGIDDPEKRPIVYAHSKDFLATTALVRLIELTAAVRTTSESGLHHRVPGMIKDGLDRFLAWAAEDGGYHHRRVVPNIITEVVDTRMPEHAITELLQGRMRALARLQREFLREDRDSDFWRSGGITTTTTTAAADAANAATAVGADRKHLLLQRYLSPRRNRHPSRYHPGSAAANQRRRGAHPVAEDELARAPHPQQMAGHDTAAPKRRRMLASTSPTDLDELAQPGDPATMMSPSPPSERLLFSSPSPAGPYGRSPAAVKYRRQPPVVYGFFILNSSVFILTVDASLGDHAYVSFHVEADFMEHRQSVWNALTLAMVACLARDEMRERADDFEEQPEEEDSDPDL
ncbi:hypothetical protein CCM_07191 [Cordyceps militaris CM01]|uniref:Uncharacterized protein n=1 Tax=Cordyceps militaris (strain CM01) TaxID=983644 RepID=G3JM47_CORMM|nr:uncharacterized protein CCM_07191 [Cordyceps militaris CM01]EGX90771.1 hypothetical protein CCM_07191 [Cordyceps militaris CM01]